MAQSHRVPATRRCVGFEYSLRVLCRIVPTRRLEFLFEAIDIRGIAYPHFSALVALSPIGKSSTVRVERTRGRSMPHAKPETPLGRAKVQAEQGRAQAEEHLRRPSYLHLSPDELIALAEDTKRLPLPELEALDEAWFAMFGELLVRAMGKCRAPPRCAQRAGAS
jgi:hypothetical protein